MSQGDTPSTQERHSSSGPNLSGIGCSRRRFLTDAARAGVALALVPGAAVLRSAARQIRWEDLSPVRARLEAQGLTTRGFAAEISRIHQENLRRVREGDLDHLVFYALQSTHFTADPVIEPALSAR